MYGPSKGMYKTSNKSDIVDAIAVRKDVQVLVLESGSESTIDSGLEQPVQAEAIRPTIEQNVHSPEYQITVVPNSGNNAFLVRRIPESGRDILSVPTLQESPRSAGSIFLGGTERPSVSRRARSDNDIMKRSKNDEYILADKSHNMQDSRRMLMFLKQVADKRDLMNAETKSNSGSHRSTVSGRTRRTIIPVIPIKKQRRDIELNSGHNVQSLQNCLQKSNFVERTKNVPRMARLASLKCIRFDQRPLRSMKSRFQYLRPLSFNRQCSGYDDDYNDPDPEEEDQAEKKAIAEQENYEENIPQPTAPAVEAREFHCVCEEGLVCRVSKQQNSKEQLEEEEFEEMEEMEENAEPEPSHHSSTRSPTRSVQDTVQYQYCTNNDCQNMNFNAGSCDCIETIPMETYGYCTNQTCTNQSQSCPRPIERSRQNCETGIGVASNILQSVKASDYCAIPSNHSRSPTQSVQNQQCMRQGSALRSRQNCECNANQTYQQPMASPQIDYCTNETCFVPLQKSGQKYFSQSSANRSCISQSSNKRVRQDNLFSQQAISCKRSGQASQNFNRSFDKSNNNSRHQKCCGCTDCTGSGQQKVVSDQNRDSPNQSNHSSRRESQNFQSAVQVRKQTSQKCDCNYYKDQSDSFQGGNLNGPCNKRSCSSRHSRQNSLNSKSNAASKLKRSFCNASSNSSQGKQYNNVGSYGVSRVLINESRNAYEQLMPCTNSICPQQNNQPYNINAPCTNKDCSQQPPQPCTNNDCSQQHPYSSTNQNYVPQHNQYVPCTSNNVYPQNVPLQNEYSICQQQQQHHYPDGPCNEDVCHLPVAQNNVFANPCNTSAVNETPQNAKYPCSKCEAIRNRSTATCSCKKNSHTITCRIGKMRNRLLGRSKKSKKDADECECKHNIEEPGAVHPRAEPSDPSYNKMTHEDFKKGLNFSGKDDGSSSSEGAPDGSEIVHNLSSKPPEFEGVRNSGALKVCDPTCSPSAYKCVSECKEQVCDVKCVSAEYECVPDCGPDYSVTNFPQSEVLIKRVYDYCECTSNSHTYSTHSQKTASSRKPMGSSSSKNYNLKNKNITQSCECSDSISNSSGSTHNRLKASDFCDNGNKSRNVDSTQKGYSHHKRDNVGAGTCACSEKATHLTKECPSTNLEESSSSDHKLKGRQYCKDKDFSQSKKNCKCKKDKDMDSNEDEDIPEYTPPKPDIRLKCKEDMYSKDSAEYSDEESSDHKLKGRQYCQDYDSNSDVIEISSKPKPKMKFSFVEEQSEEETTTSKKICKKEQKKALVEEPENRSECTNQEVIEDESCLCPSNMGNKHTEPYKSESAICPSKSALKKPTCESQDTYTKKGKCCFEEQEEVLKGKLMASDYCPEKKKAECDDIKTSCNCILPQKSSNKSIQKCTCLDKEVVPVSHDKEEFCVCIKKPPSKPISHSRETCSRDCKRFFEKKNPNEFHDCEETTDMSHISVGKSRGKPTRSEICDENCVALKQNRSKNTSKTCGGAERSKLRKDLGGCSKERNVKESKKSSCACYDNASNGTERSFKEKPRSKSGTCCKTFWDSQPNSANIREMEIEDVRCLSEHSEHKLAKSVSQYASQRSHNTVQSSKRKHSVEQYSSHDNKSKQGSHDSRRSRNQVISNAVSESSRRRSRNNCDDGGSKEYGSNQRSQSIHRSNKDTYSNYSSKSRQSHRKQIQHNSVEIDKNSREQQRSRNSYYAECSDRKSVVKETNNFSRNSDCNDDESSMRETSSCNKPSTSAPKNYNRFESQTKSSDDDDDYDEESVEENNYHFQNEIDSDCCSHKSANFLVCNCDSESNSCDYSYESDSKEVIINNNKEDKTYITIKETRTNVKMSNSRKIIKKVSICNEMELVKVENFDIDNIERLPTPPRNPDNVFLEDYKDPKKSKKKSPVTSDTEHPTFKSTAKESVRSMGGFCNKRNRIRRRRRLNPEINTPRTLNTDEILENVTNTDANQQVNVIYINRNWGMDSSATNTAENSIHTIRSHRNARPRNSPN